MTWSTVQRQDRVVRPYYESIPIASTKGTSANTATLKNVIADLDISSGYTSETQIAAGSVARITGFRTIAFKGVDASGTTLTITVRIVGTTMWGKQVTETLTLNNANSLFAETSYAYTGKPSIYIITTNQAASDLLHAACAKFGVLFNGKSTDIYSLGLVRVGGTAKDLIVGTDALFSDTYKTIDTDDETIAIADQLVLTGFQRGLRTPFQ